MDNTLGKDEKLKSEKAITALFSAGKRVKVFPLQFVYLQKNHPANTAIKIAFSVPKRNVKLAVDRSRIKRLMREVYRKNKTHFLKNNTQQYIGMLVYTATKEISYTDLEKAFIKLSVLFIEKTTI